MKKTYEVRFNGKDIDIGTMAYMGFGSIRDILRDGNRGDGISSLEMSKKNVMIATFKQSSSKNIGDLRKKIKKLSNIEEKYEELNLDLLEFQASTDIEDLENAEKIMEEIAKLKKSEDYKTLDQLNKELNRSLDKNNKPRMTKSLEVKEGKAIKKNIELVIEKLKSSDNKNCNDFAKYLDEVLDRKSDTVFYYKPTDEISWVLDPPKPRRNPSK